ncbi:flagellin [Roseomonas sp. BN140053]|uniref:flagellin n=1 Tax=Roseomonas sp. BN140053 TaxID=3391898 RepID=UPI0039E825BD
MSTTNVLGNGTIARLMQNVGALKARSELLARQSGDGRLATVYGDEARDARQAIDLRGEIARREATSTGLTRALGRTQASQVALGRLSDIATSFYAQTTKLSATEPSAIRMAASAARSALAEVGGLLNEQNAGEYLFGGSDTANPPIPGGNPAASGMNSDIAAAIAGLSGTGATSALTATRAAALNDTAGVTPFSAFLSDPATGGGEPRRTTLVSDGTVLPTGLWANRNADATSAGETTGSWSRDLLRGLMTLAALPDAVGASNADVDAVLASLRGSFSSSADALGVEQGTLGQTEARLQAARTSQGDVVVALRTQLAGIEEVDLADTLTALQDTKTRLEASYKAISTLTELTLTSFLR